MSWVTTFRVPPPAGKRITVRFGNVVFDAAYSKWSRKWFMLIPGGEEERIEPPSLWWCEDPETRIEEAKGEEQIPTQPVERVSFRRVKKQKSVQLSLFS